MYLGSYRFHGDPDELVAAYDRLMAAFPTDSLIFHASVTVDEGLLVIDACPSKADFDAFSTSADFGAAVEQAGLPRPVVEPFGAVHQHARTSRDVLVG